MNSNSKYMRPYEYGGYATGWMAWVLQNSVISSYLTLFWTTVGMVPTLVVGMMTLLCRFVDAFTDIGFAMVGDRTHSKLGSYRPWYLMAMIPTILCFIALFFIPSSIAGNVGAVTAWMIVFYLLWGSVFSTITSTSVTALSVLQTPNPKERGLMGFFRQWAGNGGGVVASFLAMPLILKFGGGSTTDPKGFLGMALIFGVIQLVLFIPTALTMKERVPVNPGKSVPLKMTFAAMKGNHIMWGVFIINAAITMLSVLVSGLGSYYFIYVLGRADAIGTCMGMAMLIGFVFTTVVTPILSRKIRPVPLYLIAAGVMIVGFVIVILSKGNLIGTTIGLGLFFAMVSLGSVVYWRLIPDAADWAEWKIGVAVPGGISAVISFAQKVAMGLGSFVPTLILTLIGFDETVLAQTPAVVTGINVAFPVVPVVVVLISLIGIALVAKVKESEKEQIRKELDERRNQVKTAEK